MYICSIQLSKTIMKAQTLKSKVEAKLSKYNKPEVVQEMMSKHYEQASRLYSNTKSIFEFIVTVY